MKRYDVISPDGFTIHRETTYASRKKAIAAFETWKKRFKAQGYYSSNRGRIPLEDLLDHCEIMKI